MAPRIEQYRFGTITIDGQEYTQDLIILPERVIAGWWRREGHVLHPEDLAIVLEAAKSEQAPEILVIGTGAYGMMRVTAEARKMAEAAGLQIYEAPTAKAIAYYERVYRQRRVAAAIHLTC